jgi:hypothetical protein
MIIDLILDRKDGEEYNARDFYYACLRYGEVGDDITRALDSGTEKDVKKALCDYVIDNDYNKNICKYINSVNWLEGFEESKKSARKSLTERLRYDPITLELIQDDIELYFENKGYDVKIIDSGMAKALNVSYIYICKGKDFNKIKSDDLYDFLYSDAINGLLYYNHDFNVVVKNKQIMIILPKTRDYTESNKSVRKSLKEKVTVAKSLKIIERALLDLIHDDTIQEEFNMAFDDVDGIYDSVDDMFEVSVHNVLNKLLKEHTITVLPF